MSSLILQGVSYAYNGTKVIDNLDLTLGKDEIVCLLGASGCGKTTTRFSFTSEARSQVVEARLRCGQGRVRIGQACRSSSSSKDTGPRPQARSFTTARTTRRAGCTRATRRRAHPSSQPHLAPEYERTHDPLDLTVRERTVRWVGCDPSDLLPENMSGTKTFSYFASELNPVAYGAGVINGADGTVRYDVVGMYNGTS